MILPIQLSKESCEPIYQQIEKQLKTLIAGGHLQAGDHLPSIRRLAKDLEVSVITTRRAYQNLEQKGYIETIQGKGTFVKAIDQQVKEEIKASYVYQSFTQAIDIAFKYDYSPQQIKDIFLNILRYERRNDH